ncbi:hypothetical protein QUF86_16770 [Peribacillus sp. NJ11]|uniref:hypothetical protein n=1 Tax=Peribacillus sp. NJ11 TaxID=3055861 RepID=UPI0025A17DBC|nr:hypothetical protein [Peribacillus sp. NJ11]MDM5222374.1 hypothetical protein [Peribacillus sp. NJ11]
MNMAESDVLGFHDLPDYLYRFQPPIHTRGLSLDEMVAEYEKSIIQSFFLGGQIEKIRKK